MESPATNRWRELEAQKIALETEAALISLELNSPGPNGEPPAGIKTPVIDSEGFPRGDIDVHSVLIKRNRLAAINFDFKQIMKSIEEILPQVFLERSLDLSRKESPKIEESPVISSPPSLTSFAIVADLSPESPASSSGLTIGDEILQFGDVTTNLYPISSEAFHAIPSVVSSSVGMPIRVIIRRRTSSSIVSSSSSSLSSSSSTSEVSLELTPRLWAGRGLLGCHLKQLSPDPFSL